MVEFFARVSLIEVTLRYVVDPHHLRIRKYQSEVVSHEHQVSDGSCLFRETQLKRGPPRRLIVGHVGKDNLLGSILEDKSKDVLSAIGPREPHTLEVLHCPVLEVNRSELEAVNFFSEGIAVAVHHMHALPI
jgi:hypothetical protein